MNFDHTTPHNPAHEDRPSYYIYHRARAYGAQAPNASYPPDSKRYEPLEFLPDPKPASIDRGPQTVEDLVRDGYFAVSKREPETAVIVDRQDMAWLTLDDALTQIREREEIYRKNLLEIEWAKCYAFGELARLGWPASDQTSALYQRRIADLHADQRAERVRFWNDLSRVRQLVPPSAQLYLSAIRKSQILGLDEGDSL